MGTRGQSLNVQNVSLCNSFSLSSVIYPTVASNFSIITDLKLSRICCNFGILKNIFDCWLGLSFIYARETTQSYYTWYMMQTWVQTEASKGNRKGRCFEWQEKLPLTSCALLQGSFLFGPNIMITLFYALVSSPSPRSSFFICQHQYPIAAYNHHPYLIKVAAFTFYAIFADLEHRRK